MEEPLREVMVTGDRMVFIDMWITLLITTDTEQTSEQVSLELRNENPASVTINSMPVTGGIPTRRAFSPGPVSYPPPPPPSSGYPSLPPAPPSPSLSSSYTKITLRHNPYRHQPQDHRTAVHQ